MFLEETGELFEHDLLKAVLPGCLKKLSVKLRFINNVCEEIFYGLKDHVVLKQYLQFLGHLIVEHVIHQLIFVFKMSVEYRS